MTYNHPLAHESQFPVEPTVVGHLDARTGKPATVYTPPECLVPAALESLGQTEGSRVAPWLVLLAHHMPEACDDGTVCCSCGNPLYVGHLVRLIADRVDHLAAPQPENPETTTPPATEH